MVFAKTELPENFKWEKTKIMFQKYSKEFDGLYIQYFTALYGDVAQIWYVE